MTPVARQVVRLCYHLDGSERYAGFKRLFRDLLTDPRSRARVYFDGTMMVLVLTSVALLVHEVEHTPGAWAIAFERAVVTVFVIEYVLRAWVHDDVHATVIAHHDRAERVGAQFRLGPALAAVARAKWDYVSSPLAVIDLLAIFPTYRPMRVLRVFLLFRVFKLFRYVRSVNALLAVLTEKRFEFLTLAIFLAFITLAASTALYLFEGGREGGDVTGFLDAVYWSMVTLSTVGYGDITPHSLEGRVVTMALILSGIGFMALTTSVVVTALTERLDALRDQRVLGELEKLRDYTVVCGYGRVGRVVVEKLAAEGAGFVVIDSDPDKVERARRQGYLAVLGDASADDLLDGLGIRERAATVLCTTHDDVANVFVTLSARHMNPRLRIIARANQHASIRKLELAGADHVVAPFRAVGLVAAEYVGRPVAFEAIHGILSGEHQIVIDAVPVAAGSFADGATVGALGLEAHRLVLFGIATEDPGVHTVAGEVFALARHHFRFNPAKETALAREDLLVVFGHALNVAHLRRSLELSALEDGRTRS